MKAVGIRNGKGDADALFIEHDVPDPIATDDHILVRVHAFGLNRMDIMQREDRYPYPLLPESGKILGVEFSGVVEGKGPECTGDFTLGDEVFGLAYGGAYAQKISVSEKMLLHRPSNLTCEEAAGMPETFFTAIQAIHLLGNLQPSQSVLIHAGSSGVGQSAIQLARQAGASKILTTAGTDAKCALCRSLGADVAINYRSNPDFTAIVHQETDSRGVDLTIDLVGKDYFHANVACAATDARMVIVAAMSGSVVGDFDLRALMNKRLWLMTTTLRTRDVAYQRSVRDVFVERVLPAVERGEIRVVVDSVYPWGEVSEAHKRLESGAHVGKIVCTVE